MHAPFPLPSSVRVCCSRIWGRRRACRLPGAHTFLRAGERRASAQDAESRHRAAAVGTRLAIYSDRHPDGKLHTRLVALATQLLQHHVRTGSSAGGSAGGPAAATAAAAASSTSARRALIAARSPSAGRVACKCNSGKGFSRGLGCLRHSASEAAVLQPCSTSTLYSAECVHGAAKTARSWGAAPRTVVGRSSPRG